MAEYKFNEVHSCSSGVAPTATTGISSTSLVDMQLYDKVTFQVCNHRLPDAKGEGVITVTVYESASSTWSASATVITASVATATLNSVSDSVVNLTVRVNEMSNNDTIQKRYLGCYIKPNTSTVVAGNVMRWKGSYNPQS